MAKRANPTVIGAFAVGAAVLAVAGIFLFGSARLFADTVDFVACFSGSLKGLSVGSPVTLRGIEIGSVKDISVLFDVDKMEFRVPVVIEIDRRAIKRIQGSKEMPQELRMDPREVAKMFAATGFRAQLETRSFVTGMLQVALVFQPNTEAKLTGVESKYPEIPTIPTTAEQLSRTLESLPIKELVTNLQHVTQTLEELATSPRLENSMAALEETLKNLRAITADLGKDTEGVAAQIRAAVADIRGAVDRLNRQIEPLASSVRAALEQGQRALQNANEQTIPRLNALLERADGKLDPLASSLANAIASARAALDAATDALKSVGETTTGASGIQNELSAALKELTSAARAIRDLADYLERHPESLLQGKGGR